MLALQALENSPGLSIRAAAATYTVDFSTLARRRRGQCSIRDAMPNSRKLTDLEESTIVQYVIDLGTRAFPPRLRDSLLANLSNLQLDIRNLHSLLIKILNHSLKDGLLLMRRNRLPRDRLN